ncbi:hypothetical protein EVAR_99219_1 [Eumeta japonica]|uniref:Uncharacterized protein n=1 Tax=Eumeta variegata TaxID=151549 RepID=A0A4C1YLV4_EUMVA|nr:hypothetical protein EVAR_99219_1 [Eumeta japonica]
MCTLLRLSLQKKIKERKLHFFFQNQLQGKQYNREQPAQRRRVGCADAEPNVRGRVSQFWDTRKVSRFLNPERQVRATLQRPRSILTSAQPRMNSSKFISFI